MCFPKDFFFNEKGFPGGSLVKYLPNKQEMPVWSLDQENPLDKEMETRWSSLAWRIPQREGYISWGHKESDTA